MRWPFWKSDTEEPGANTPCAAASAYLDGELAPAERQQFEADLARNPELAAELESLRETKAVLQAMPEVMPRRSFALTPEMAAANRTEEAPIAVTKPARPPLLLYFGQVATAAGVIGLMVVGLSTVFSGSRDGDDSGGGDLTMASSADTNMHSGTGPAAVPMTSESATRNSTDGDSAGGSTDAGGGSGSVNGATPAAGAPESITQAEPPVAQEAQDLANQGENYDDDATADSILAQDAAKSIGPGQSERGGSGPSGRQLAVIVFGLLAAFGGGAWLAVSTRRARES